MMRVLAGSLLSFGLVCAVGCGSKSSGAGAPGPDAGGTLDGGGSSGDGGASGQCSLLHFTPHVALSVELLLDASGSMSEKLVGGETKFAELTAAITGATGVVPQLQATFDFGANVFDAPTAGPCPRLLSAPRARNNATTIATLIANSAPNGNTPTTATIDAAVAGFVGSPPAAGTPPVIVIATDGVPSSCAGNTVDTAAAVVAATNAAAKGIPVLMMGVGAPTGADAQYLVEMANAGKQVQPGQPNAPVYDAGNPDALVAALRTLGSGVTSCDFTLSATVDTASVTSAMVTLDGTALTAGVDWTLDADGVTLHILGAVCTALRTAPSPVLDASFPCSGTAH